MSSKWDGFAKRVLKWDVPVDDHEHPIGAGRVVHVACQYEPYTVQVWTEETPVTEGLESRQAQVYGTGQLVPVSANHLGSVIATSDGTLVWHVYGNSSR